MSRNFLLVDPAERPDVLHALASEVRVSILKLLHIEGPMNVNDIAARLNQPQSTISSNMQILVGAELVRTETQKARKGNQKICHSLFDEVLVMFKEDIRPIKSNSIEVAMPLGLYSSCDVSAPCGLCSSEGIIGLLDVLNAAKTAAAQPEWRGYGPEVYFGISLMYFVFCFAMSKYSQQVEVEFNRHKHR